ncbi:MAG: hypothetical protein JW915_12120 [Chitinispirillaceae bacterium]|nr:hypothetical protein [Chitinispirillaceae bacterium]
MKRKKLCKHSGYTVFLITTVLITSIFAQTQEKFQIYGFSDMTISKCFPKENSFSYGVDKMDEKANFSLDHVNLYTSFRPNKHVRFLAELSFQESPVNYNNVAGTRIIMNSPFLNSDSVYTVAEIKAKNRIQRGITIFEWGSFSVERAMMSLNLNRYWNFSAGKFITPAGVWNVDHGSPVIMTISQPTQYSYAEIFPKSQIGIMEEGKIFLGDADLSYVVYLSSGRDNQSLYRPTDLSVGGQVRMNLPLLDECTFGLSGYRGKANIKLREGVITMNTVDFVTFDSKTVYEDSNVVNYHEKVYGIDMRLRKYNLTFQSELNYQDIDNNVLNGAKTGIFGNYYMLAYDAYKKDNLTLTPYGLFEYVKYYDEEKHPNANPYALREGYRKVMAGLNIRAFTNYGIKLEYNFTRLLMQDYSTIKRDECDIPGVGAQFYVAF